MFKKPAKMFLFRIYILCTVFQRTLLNAIHRQVCNNRALLDMSINSVLAQYTYFGQTLKLKTYKCLISLFNLDDCKKIFSEECCDRAIQQDVEQFLINVIPKMYNLNRESQHLHCFFFLSEAIFWIPKGICPDEWSTNQTLNFFFENYFDVGDYSKEWLRTIISYKEDISADLRRYPCELSKGGKNEAYDFIEKCLALIGEVEMINKTMRYFEPCMKDLMEYIANIPKPKFY